MCKFLEGREYGWPKAYLTTLLMRVSQFFDNGL